MALPVALAEGDEREIAKSSRAQPLGGHQRALAAATTKDNASGWWRLRDQFLNMVDIESMRTRKRRNRCLVQPAQIDDQVVGRNGRWRNERHRGLGFGTSAEAEAAESETFCIKGDDLA